MSATVYLIHFEQPFKHARHYLGSAKDVQKRVAKHRKGKGAKLLKHVTAAGIDWSVVRTWAEGGRQLEAKFKRAQHNSRLCPICSEMA